jgi:hypothetical protein
MKGVRNALLISAVIYSLVYLCACSVKFEIGYHGETGRDDRTMTQGKGK